MTDDSIKASVVKRFHSIPGLGLTKAELLFESGFTTLSSLKRATAEEISAVKGITPSMARYLLREVQVMPDDVEVKDEASEGDVETTTGDPDTASIKLGDEVPATDDETDEEAEDDEGPPSEAEKDEGPGFLSGMINSFKSLFGGGEKPEPSEEEAAAEEPEPEEGPTEEPEATTEETPEAEPKAEPKAEPEKEPAEASITVDHDPEDEAGPTEEEAPDEKEEVEEKEAEVEPMPEEPPEAETRSTISDIKAKGFAKIKALRERIYGKKKDDGPEEEPEEKKEEPIEEKVEEGPEEKPEEPEEAKEPEEPEEPTKKKAKAKPTSKDGKAPKENKKLVDNIIKELDLDADS